MEELLRLGVLDDNEYIRLLRCVVGGGDVTLNACEVVRCIIEAREVTHPQAPSNPTLINLYQDILNRWLLPPLLNILQHNKGASKDSSESHNTNIIQKNNVERLDCIPVSCSASDGEGENQEQFDNPEPAVQIKSEDVNIITKLCNLVALISRIVFDAHVDAQSALECNDLQGSTRSEVQEISEPSKRIFKAIAACFRLKSQDGVTEKQHIIKLLSHAFSSLVRDGWYAKTLELQHAARLVMEAILSNGELWHDPEITASLFTLVIQPYLKTSSKDEREIFQKLWVILFSFYNVEDGIVVEKRTTVGLVVLCFLIDLMSHGEIFTWISNDETFWVVLQHSLAHSDSYSRKRARYVLRKVIDHNSSERPSSEYLPWPHEQKNNLQQLWSDFFLLLETLEEKQTHVVKPVLEKIDKLIRSCQEGKMHMSWVVVVLRRVLDQDNRTVRVWGASKVLSLRLPQQVMEQGFLTFITHHFLLALADYSLYSREPGQQAGDPSRVGNQIPDFLSSVVSSLDKSLQCRFLCTLLEQLFDGQPWGGIPLFYLMRGLALIPPTPVWTYTQSRKAAINLESCLSTQEVTLRSASQCDFLRAVLRHSSPNTTFLDLCHIVSHVRRQESWQRGTTTWNAILEGVASRHERREDRLHAVQQAISDQLSASFQKNVQPHDAALALCLLGEEECEGVEEVLAPLTLFLQDCHLRPYLSPCGRVWAVQFLTHVMEILFDSSLVAPDCPEQPLAVLAEGLGCLLELFVSQLVSYNSPHHLEDLQLYLRLLRHSSRMKWSREVVWSLYPEMLEGCKGLLEQQQPVPTSLGVVMLEHLLEHYFSSAPQSYQKEAVQLLTLHPEALTQTRLLPGHQPSPATTQLLMETPCSCWHSVELLLQAKESWWHEGETKRVEAVVLKVLLECVSTASHSTVPHVFQVARIMAPTLVKAGMWEEVVQAMWAASFEFRKGCDLYRTLIRCLTDLLFHGDAMACPDCHASIIKVSQEILKAGDGVQGVASHMACSLASSLVKAGVGEPGWFRLMAKEVLAPLLMFGSVFRKQHRVIRDTLLFVRSCGDLYTCSTQREGDPDSDCRARATALRYLLSLRAERAEDRMAAAAVAEGIKHQYAQSSALRRDFPNSQNHRYKTRLLQAFLVLLPLLDREDCENHLIWLSEGLTCDHQQPSIRYAQEWGAALLPILHPNLHTTLLQLFLKGAETRMGCVGSFLAALTHAACTSLDPTVLSSALQHTLAWCTAQHFNTRLYAQVSLRKIWQHCEEQQMEAVLQEFRAVPLCLIQHGNAARNTINMLNDFYFKVFHPVRHYTLQTIFHDLPRLSLLADDEWMTVESLVGVADEEHLPIHTSLPRHNPDSVLTMSTPAPWVVKAAGEEQQAGDEVAGEVDNVQKKIVPQKVLVPEGSSLPHQGRWEGRHGDLIVVATLVDKAANLGGLCRSCEAFGVRELVVSSLAVLQDQTFTSLALTAQRWLPIKEVRREDLLTYLRARQAEGYMLVGAEQTAQSISLEDFTFPDRTVVVLGNERAGVPCEVLQVLQASVQIPQSGTVRSLNVHVSGALFVWEYTRQILTRSPNAKGIDSGVSGDKR